MGERSEYPPGTFCWADLTTTDQEAAKGFYGELFGWEADDRPIGDGFCYSMMSLRGNDAAAISPQPRQQREAGVPPLWNSYVSVASADEVATKAKELGADVHAPPFDVLEAGRMAVLADPQGAFFCLWEPREHYGAAVVNGSGALSWNELATSSVDGASDFYGELFGWTIAPFESGADPYLSIRNGEAYNGGIRQLDREGAPPHWLVYFGADDIDASLARAGELGGSTLARPLDIQLGTVAIVSDPQGAVFALYAGQFEA